MKTTTRIVSAFFALAAFAVAARSQAPDQLVTDIPYEFVAAGETLPAGTYTVRRISDHDINELIITSVENRIGVLLLSTQVSDTREYKPGISFEQVGDQHFLSKIETAGHIFTIPVSKKAVVLAKNQTTPSNTRSSGSN